MRRRRIARQELRAEELRAENRGRAAHVLKPMTSSSQKPAFAQCSMANEAPIETFGSSEP